MQERQEISHTQLKGRIFKHGGVNYLVIEDNDFTADTLWVKTVDRRYVFEMPLENVLQSLVGDFVPRKGQRAA